MIAFLISALLTGFVVVFVLPWVKGFVDKVPGVSAVTGNKLVQLLIVGSIVLLGLGVFGMIARRLGVHHVAG